MHCLETMKRLQEEWHEKQKAIARHLQMERDAADELWHAYRPRPGLLSEDLAWHESGCYDAALTDRSDLEGELQDRLTGEPGRPLWKIEDDLATVQRKIDRIQEPPPYGDD